MLCRGKQCRRDSMPDPMTDEERMAAANDAEEWYGDPVADSLVHVQGALINERVVGVKFVRGERRCQGTLAITTEDGVTVYVTSERAAGMPPVMYVDTPD
jgi:hypothetical protein